jgi:hypothetical protein
MLALAHILKKIKLKWINQEIGIIVGHHYILNKSMDQKLDLLFFL